MRRRMVVNDAIVWQEEDMTKNCTRFQPVSYGDLTAKQKELFNFQKIAATLADYGFNCIKLADDWQGADFLAYHINGTTTLKVQLKSRLTINQKYSGKDIWMAFPHKGHWYLIEHHCLVEKVGKHTDWLKSPSWKERDGYSSVSINPSLLESLAEDRIGPVYGSVALDDEETSEPAPLG
jgi:frataxin-like iron-binding protein CyaY